MRLHPVLLSIAAALACASTQVVVAQEDTATTATQSPPAPDVAARPESMQTTAIERPARGLTMEKVEAKFGAPSQKLESVGHPPITRWEYPGYVVYFEHEYVLHTVAVK